MVGAVHEQLIFCHGQEQGHLHCPVIFISSAVKHIVVVVAVLKAFPVKAADLGTCLGKKEQPHGSQDAEIEKDTASYAGAGIVVPSGGGKDQCQDKQRQQAGEYAENPQPQKPLFSQIAAVAVRQVQIGLCQVIHIQSQFPSFPKIKSEKQEIYPYFTIKYKIEGRRMPSFLWKINNFFTSS